MWIRGVPKDYCGDLPRLRRDNALASDVPMESNHVY